MWKFFKNVPYFSSYLQAEKSSGKVAEKWKKLNCEADNYSIFTIIFLKHYIKQLHRSTTILCLLLWTCFDWTCRLIGVNMKKLSTFKQTFRPFSIRIPSYLSIFMTLWPNLEQSQKENGTKLRSGWALFGSEKGGSFNNW